jgi:hypothetical protein
MVSLLAACTGDDGTISCYVDMGTGSDYSAVATISQGGSIIESFIFEMQDIEHEIEEFTHELPKPAREPVKIPWLKMGWCWSRYLCAWDYCVLYVYKPLSSLRLPSNNCKQMMRLMNHRRMRGRGRHRQLVLYRSRYRNS